MPPNPPPGSAREWVARANGKLALASQALPPGAYWEDLCFMAHQAAELAIKAVYQHNGWEFPLIHDLAALLDGLVDRGLKIPPDVQEADELTVFAVQTRYPGVTGPVSQEEHKRALGIARQVVAWAEKIVR